MKCDKCREEITPGEARVPTHNGHVLHEKCAITRREEIADWPFVCEDCGYETMTISVIQACPRCGSAMAGFAPPDRDESVTHDKWVEACPNCSSSMIHSRTTKTPEYRCADCGTEFVEPVERLHRHKSSNGAET